MLYSIADVVACLENDDDNDCVSTSSDVHHDENKTTRSRRNWLAFEDEFIIAKHDEIGPRWRVIAGMLAERSDDAVRNRFKRLTTDADAPHSAAPRSPQKRRRAWTAEEDATIRAFVVDYGQRWGQLRQLLHERSAYAIRNRYVRLMRIRHGRRYGHRDDVGTSPDETPPYST